MSSSEEPQTHLEGEGHPWLDLIGRDWGEALGDSPFVPAARRLGSGAT